MKHDQYKHFPVILVSKPGTLQQEVDKNKVIIYSSFETLDGKERILVIHGNHRGVFPDESREAINKFNPTRIYCCYPALCRRATGDNRIMGDHDAPTMYKKKEIGDQVVFVLTKNDDTSESLGKETPEQLEAYLVQFRGDDEFYAGRTVLVLSAHPPRKAKLLRKIPNDRWYLLFENGWDSLWAYDEKDMIPL